MPTCRCAGRAEGLSRAACLEEERQVARETLTTGTSDSAEEHAHGRAKRVEIRGHVDRGASHPHPHPHLLSRTSHTHPQSQPLHAQANVVPLAYGSHTQPDVAFRSRWHAPPQGIDSTNAATVGLHSVPVDSEQLENNASYPGCREWPAGQVV